MPEINQQKIDSARLAIVDGKNAKEFRDQVKLLTSEELGRLTASIGNQLLIDFKDKIAASNGVNIQNLSSQEVLLKLQATELGKKLKEYRKIVAEETHEKLKELSQGITTPAAISAKQPETVTPKPEESTTTPKPETPKTAKQTTEDALNKGAGFFKDKVIGPLAEKMKDVPVIGAALEWLQKLSVYDITDGIKRTWYSLLASPALLGINTSTPLFGGLIGKISTDAEINIFMLDLKKYARESGVPNVKVKEGCTAAELAQAKKILAEEGNDALKIRTQKFLEGKAEGSTIALKDVLTPAGEMAKQAEVSKQEQEVQKLKKRIVTLTNDVNIDVKIGTPEQMEWSDNEKATITLPASVSEDRIKQLTDIMKLKKISRVTKMILASTDMPTEPLTIQYKSETLILNNDPKTLVNIVSNWRSSVTKFTNGAKPEDEAIWKTNAWMKLEKFSVHKPA